MSQGGGLYNEGAGTAPARSGLRLAQAGSDKDLLGEFVVTGTVPDASPPQIRGAGWAPTVFVGVGGSFVVPFASFLVNLTGGIGGLAQNYGVFLDFSRGSLGIYKRTDVHYAIGGFAGVYYERGFAMSGAFTGAGGSVFAEAGDEAAVGAKGSSHLHPDWSWPTPLSAAWSKGWGFGAAAGYNQSFTSIIGEWQPPLF